MHVQRRLSSNLSYQLVHHKLHGDNFLSKTTVMEKNQGGFTNDGLASFSLCLFDRFL